MDLGAWGEDDDYSFFTLFIEKDTPCADLIRCSFDH